MIDQATGVDARQPVASAVATEVVYGTAAFLDLQPEWTSLFDKSRTQNPFLTWEWISTWVRHFCGESLRTVVVTDGQDVMAIAPFHLNRYLIGPGLHATALQLLGPKEVQHLFEIREILVEPGRFEGAMGAILDRVVTIPGWDWLEVSAVGEDVEALHGLLGRRDPPGFRLDVDPTTQIPIMALERTWGDQRLRLKRNIKESIRHCYNSLRRDGHTHSFDADGAHGDAEAAGRRLVDLHRERALITERRWHRDHFADRSIRDFEIDALRAMYAGQHARFAELSVDGRLVAARACLETNGSLYFYYSGFDPAWWKQSVMTLLIAEAIQDAIRRGLSNVNFSTGMDESKSRWGPELVPMQSISLVRQNPLALSRHRLLKLRKRVRQPLHRRLDRALSLAGRIRRPR